MMVELTESYVDMEVFEPAVPALVFAITATPGGLVSAARLATTWRTWGVRR